MQFTYIAINEKLARRGYCDASESCKLMLFSQLFTINYSMFFWFVVKKVYGVGYFFNQTIRTATSAGLTPEMRPA